MFNAFLSYKREDEAFAVALEKALERYTPPPGLGVPAERLRVFRDRDDLTGSEYYRAIDASIANSSKMIVLCSPHARKSSYVNDEIRRFADAKGAEHLMPVLLSGIPNNEAKTADDLNRAFPDALCELMAMPLAVEYRGFDPKKDRIDRGRFEASWYTLLADLYGVSRADLEQRDRKRQARALRLRLQMAAAVVVALVGLTIWALFSRQQAIVARQQAISRQLAASALVQVDIDPDASLELSVKALESSRTPEAEEALRRAAPRAYLQMVLRGHTGWVNDATYSGRGEFIATASNDKTVRIWDGTTGAVRHVLPHQSKVRSVAFNYTTGRLLTVQDDPIVSIWDAQSGTRLASLEGHTGDIRAATWNPTGTRVATASLDGTVRLWDGATGQPIGAPLEHGAPVWSVAFSPDDGALLASGADDGIARVWTVARPQKPRLIRGHTGAVTIVTFNAEGNLLITGSMDKTGRVTELNGEKSWPLEGHQWGVTLVGVNSNADVVTVSDKTPLLWKHYSGKSTPVRGHTDWINSLDFSSNGLLLATASEDGTARLWDAQTGVPVAILRGHTDTVFHARFNLERTAVVTASADGTARVWRVPPMLRLSGHDDWVTGAAFSRDGTRVVTASWDGRARVWDANTALPPFETEPVESDPLDRATFSPDGRFFVTAGVSGVARVWDVARMAEVLTLTGHGVEVLTANYSADGTRILTSGRDGTARIWDATSGKEIWNSGQIHNGSLTSAAFSPDSRRVLTTGNDQQARIVNLDTGAVTTFDGHRGLLRSGAFSADGRFIVTTSGDMTTRIWEAETGREVRVLGGHTARTTDANFSPDGRLVVTASADKTARVWEVSSGRLLALFDHHADLISSASFSPDGKRVLLSSDDRTATVVECPACDLSIDELLEQNRARRN